MEKVLYSKDSQKVSIQIAEPTNIDSFFVFAVPKAGSVLQDKIIEDIAHELNIPLVSIAKSAFNQGVEEGNFNEEICSVFAAQGYGFYGFRYFPGYLKNFDLSNFKKILLIRDPRDILVSHYFSMKNSHAIPTGEMGDRLLLHRQNIQNMDINQYVLEKAPRFLNIFRAYSQLTDSLLKVFRYEDIIFNKAQWIQDLLNFLELNLSKSQIEAIASKHDIFPTEEAPDSHIRKVTPGDYREKLKPDTIESLNDIFAEVITTYGYVIEEKKSIYIY